MVEFIREDESSRKCAIAAQDLSRLIRIAQKIAAAVLRLEPAGEIVNEVKS